MIMKKLKNIIKKIPLLNKIAISVLRIWMNVLFPGSIKYWEKRYSSGGNSGYGSYGKFAKFKAKIINSFVRNNKIKSIIEFGCGDGNQLSLFDFPNYKGLDVSKTAINLCRERFKNDKTKSFFFYDPKSFKENSEFKAELALSLDVIFHLIEDDIFESYMSHLFSSSRKFVIIYSSNMDIKRREIDHVRHRRFTDWVKTNLPEWKLIKRIKNIYSNETPTDFFIFKKVKK